MDKKKTGLMLSILGVISLVLITAGVTYAFFNYAKEGTTDNVITTGSITFLYTEVSGVGNGISIENAFPTSDEVGKVATGEGEYFDFKITSETGNNAIPYEVTARKSKTSDDIDEYIRVYLTKGATNEEVLLDNYDNLTQTSKVSVDTYTEKTIYTDTVPANTDYEETFRLRMWLSDDANFSDGSMNNKTFTLTVNVYANAKVVTEEEIAYSNNTNITIVLADDTALTKVENEDYDYETTLDAGTTSTTINIETENPNATVEVEKLDSLAYNTSKIKRLAVTKTLELIEGDNYFQVTVTSESKEVTNQCVLKISVPVSTPYKAYSIGDAVTATDGSKWHVLEASDGNTETVVLLSDYNLNSDGSYNTECGSDIDGTYQCSVMAFDPDDTSIYDETDSNNIGYFIKNTYAPQVTSALSGTTKVSLPTAEQIAMADGQALDVLKLFNSWLATTDYWMLDDTLGSESRLWVVVSGNISFDYTSSGYYGARPVITTPKTNLITE